MAKTKVRKTSIDCYNSKVRYFMNNQEEKIYSALLKEATRGEIAHYLKMEKSSVSARVNNMLKHCILQEVGKRKDKISGIENYVVAINEQEELF